MTPEIGQFALSLTLAFALIQGVPPMIGAAPGNTLWMHLAKAYGVPGKTQKRRKCVTACGWFGQ